MGDFTILNGINGNKVIIEHKEIQKVLAEPGFRLFGMTLRVIQALRHEYDRRDGPDLMTTESIRSVFNE